MINVAICDDENIIINQVETIIDRVCNNQLIKCEIDVFYGGKTLKEQVIAGKHYDIIFLDIEMNNEDGILAGQQIRAVDENTILIYISGHEHYLLELFQLDVFRFIRKPICETTLEKYFLDAYQKICNNRTYYRLFLTCRNDPVMICLHVRDLLCILSLSYRKKKVSANPPDKTCSLRPNP